MDIKEMLLITTFLCQLADLCCDVLFVYRVHEKTAP